MRRRTVTTSIGRVEGVDVATFETADPDQARTFLDRTYGAQILTDRRRTQMRLTVTRTDAGSFSQSDLALSAEFTFLLQDQGNVRIDTIGAGTFQTDRGKDTARYQTGDAFIACRPGASHTVRTRDFRAHAVVLPLALLAKVAGPAPQRPPVPLRFLAADPLSVAARHQWRATTRFVTDVLTSPQAGPRPLVAGSAGQLLAATALAVFPSNALTDPTAADRHDASTATVQRAVDFIHDHAREDLSAADVAAAAGVTIRAVQLAFRTHLDTTPMRYLRRIRLEHVHRQLRAADPARESVPAIAAQWGFASLGRFTRYYRQAYGVMPQETLHGD
jgi:AraC-like DNA-binding protein